MTVSYRNFCKYFIKSEVECSSLILSSIAQYILKVGIDSKIICNILKYSFIGTPSKSAYIVEISYNKCFLE